MMVTQSKAIEAILSRTEKEKKTNFDFLTDKPKTLASWLEANVRCEHCQIYKYCKKNIKADEDCGDVWEKWLKQESK